MEELAAFNKKQAPEEDVPRNMYTALVKKLRMAQFLIVRKLDDYRLSKSLCKGKRRPRLPE